MGDALAAAIAQMNQASQPFFKIWETNPLTGKSEQDVDKWFDTFEYLANLVNDITDNQRLTEVKKAVQGKAQEIVRSADAAQIDTYANAKTLLLGRLAQPHRPLIYRQQFTTRTKKSDESIADYIADLRKMVRLAYPPNTAAEATALVLKERFIAGLLAEKSHPNYKLWKTAYSNQTENLDAIITAVTTTESTQRMFSLSLTTNHDTASSNVEVEAYAHSRSGSSNQGQKRQPQQGLCPYDGFRHKLEECKSMKEAQATLDQSQQRGCWYCGEDHQLRDCHSLIDARRQLSGCDPCLLRRSEGRRKSQGSSSSKNQQMAIVETEEVDPWAGFSLEPANEFGFVAIERSNRNHDLVDEFEGLGDRIKKPVEEDDVFLAEFGPFVVEPPPVSSPKEVEEEPSLNTIELNTKPNEEETDKSKSKGEPESEINIGNDRRPEPALPPPQLQGETDLSTHMGKAWVEGCKWGSKGVLPISARQQGQERQHQQRNGQTDVHHLHYRSIKINKVKRHHHGQIKGANRHPSSRRNASQYRGGQFQWPSRQCHHRHHQHHHPRSLPRSLPKTNANQWKARLRRFWINQQPQQQHQFARLAHRTTNKAKSKSHRAQGVGVDQQTGRGQSDTNQGTIKSGDQGTIAYRTPGDV